MSDIKEIIEEPSIESIYNMTYEVEAAITKVMWNLPPTQKLPLLISACNIPMGALTYELKRILQQMGEKENKLNDRIIITALLLVRCSLLGGETSPMDALKIALEDVKVLKEAGRI